MSGGSAYEVVDDLPLWSHRSRRHLSEDQFHAVFFDQQTDNWEANVVRGADQLESRGEGLPREEAERLSEAARDIYVPMAAARHGGVPTWTWS